MIVSDQSFEPFGDTPAPGRSARGRETRSCSGGTSARRLSRRRSGGSTIPRERAMSPFWSRIIDRIARRGGAAMEKRRALIQAIPGRYRLVDTIPTGPHNSIRNDR